MNTKTISRKIAAFALVLAASAGTIAATTTSASAAYGSDDVFDLTSRGTHMGGTVTYTGTQTVTVYANLRDATGDAYCTTLKAAVYGTNGGQLGNDITIGSVCSGRTALLPVKRISVQAANGRINSVLVWTTKGANGLSNGGVWCYPNSDIDGPGLVTC